MTAALLITGAIISVLVVGVLRVYARARRTRPDLRTIIDLERQLDVHPGTVTRADVALAGLSADDGPAVIRADQGLWLTVTKRHGFVTELGRTYPTLYAATEAAFPDLWKEAIIDVDE